MRSSLFVLLLVVGCRQDRAPAPSLAATTASAAPSTSLAAVDAAPPDASSLATTPEQRAAYRAALLEGRQRTIQKKYDEAVQAFGRALAAIPDDARALAERGYARHLARDDAAAKIDLERAAQTCDPKDKKLLAQIEFNLGLVCDALAERGDDEQRGAAAGHYWRSNALQPTAAAAAKMGPCPASWGTPKTDVYVSLAAAEGKLDAGAADLDALPDGVWVRERPGDATDVLLPIDRGRYARVEVGPIDAWRCGRMGEVSAKKAGGAWHVVYQAHRGAAGGACTCDDTFCSTTDDPAEGPPCKCAAPICRMTCAGADAPEGPHVEAWVDASSGAGVMRTEIPHAFLNQVSCVVDLAAKRFRASGLGCVADLPLP